jgi:hypothetical protein
MHRLAYCAGWALIRIGSACAAGLLAAADAAGACTDSPIEYASTINRRLETQQLRELYAREFSDAFKARHSFGEFSNNVTNVQDSLRIGGNRGRSFDGREIARPSIIGVWYPTHLGSHAESRELPPVATQGRGCGPGIPHHVGIRQGATEDPDCLRRRTVEGAGFLVPAFGDIEPITLPRRGAHDCAWTMQCVVLFVHAQTIARIGALPRGTRA